MTEYSVKNRDIAVIANIDAIMQQVYALENCIEFERGRAMNITSRLSGMPGGHGGGSAGKIESAAIKIVELEREHEEAVKRYCALLRKSERILKSLQSEKLRAFVVMKYCMNRSNAEIGQTLNMSRHTVDRAIRAVEDADCMANVVWKDRYAK